MYIKLFVYKIIFIKGGKKQRQKTIMSNVKFLDQILQNINDNDLEYYFIKALNQICIKLNNQNILCKTLGIMLHKNKYIRNKKIIIKNLYRKIITLIGEKKINFLTPYMHLNGILSFNIKYPEMESFPLGKMESFPLGESLHVINKLYEFIILNGINDGKYIYIFYNQLYNFYNMYINNEVVCQLIKYNNIEFFLQNFAKDLIKIENNSSKKIYISF